MKITLNNSKLAKSLSFTSRAVSAKPNIPILSNVLLKVENTFLKLSATNLDMGIIMWIPGKVDTEGSATVNAKYIADFVNAAIGEKVELNLNENSLMVKTDKSKASFNTIAPEEFPVLPKVNEEPVFKIKPSDLIESLTKVIFACSTDLSSGRIQQSGVLFSINKEISSIDFIGLDGFRLSKKTAKISDLSEKIAKDEIIVPSKYLSELIKVILEYPEVEEIGVYLSENNSQIIFKFEEVEFSIRLLEGPYPDYKRIMPDGATFKFEVKKSDLENSIKVVNSFAKGNLGNKALADLEVEKSSLIMKSAVADVGEGETEFEVSNLEAESDLNTAYTIRYLQDLVNHIKGDTIIFETKGALAASVFRDKEDSNFIHLIMPMRREV